MSKVQSRIIAAALAAALLTPTLAGCGQKNDISGTDAAKLPAASPSQINQMQQAAQQRAQRNRSNTRSAAQAPPAAP